MKRLLLLGLLACNSGGGSTAPPAPTYNPSTLLVANQSGLVLDLTFRCCGSQELLIPAVLPSTKLCITMTNVLEMTMEAVSSDSAYKRANTILQVQSSPGWIWTLLPANDEVRPTSLPCG
jgi:hypothetical protein